MVKLKDIETTQGEVPQVIEQWFTDRGLGSNLSSHKTMELMRYIERLEEGRQASEQLNSLNSVAITELLTEIKWLKAELEGKKVHRVTEEQAKPITWTTTKPTRPGWYWWRTRTRSGKWCKIRMEEVRSNMTVSGWGEIDKLDGEWSSSPIPEPQEVQP